jgi:hypothetical protein
MGKFLRLAAGACCLGVLALGVFTFDPTCLPTASLPGDADRRLSMAEEVALRERLNQQQEAIRQRDEAKRKIAAEVIARWKSLAEAIEQFRALNQQWPPFPRPEPIIIRAYGMSEEEWDGREVFRFVQLVLADHPDEAAAVVGRLEKELRQLLSERAKRRPALAERSR